MTKHPEHIKAWIEVAEMDLTAARTLAKDDFLARIVGFHAQQAAEKWIKAVMASQNLVVPNSHKRTRLAETLATVLPELANIEKDMAWLSTFAVEVRYPLAPGPATTSEHAERAIKIAEQIKDICLHHRKGEVQ